MSLGFPGPTDNSTSLLSNKVEQTTAREAPGLRVMKPCLLQKALYQDLGLRVIKSDLLQTLYQGVCMDVGRRKRSNWTDWDLEHGSLGLTGL